MKRLVLIFGFYISMILFTLYIMNLSYKNGDAMFSFYFGLGIPVWIYLIVSWAKFLNRVELNQRSITIKNWILGHKTIDFNDIEQWEVINTERITQQNLLIKAKGKTLIISNMINEENYENLCYQLRTNLAELEK